MEAARAGTPSAGASCVTRMPHEAERLPGFFVAGFECSSHRLRSGRRLDLLASTQHVRHADADYERLAHAGIRCAREGLNWPLIEAVPGRYDFSTVLPVLRAARRHGVRVIWDVMHFGWPDDVDVFRPSFVARLAALAARFAEIAGDEIDGVPWISPINETSFLAWAGGDVAAFNPFAHGRGFELKCQFVRATIAVIEAFRDANPATRFVHHDPAFHVTPDVPEDADACERTRLAQFQALDLLAGRQWPQLGGREDYLDMIGINYYPWNQWTYGSPLVPTRLVAATEAAYRPLSSILVEWHARYDRPVYVGETGCEGDTRAAWLRYVCDEVVIARAHGATVDGVCLYPIVNFPGWDDDRHCHNGLWDYADDRGRRDVHVPLADELARQQRRFDAVPTA